jgi:hypothetical protein
MPFVKGNDGWKHRKSSKGGRPKKRPAVETSCVDVSESVSCDNSTATPVNGVHDATGREVAVTGDVVVPEVEDEGGDSDISLITHPKKRAMLEAYAKLGTVNKAAEAVGCGAWIHYYWQRTDDEYRQAFAVARHAYSEYLLSVVHERATRAEKPSDLLLMFGVKGLRPDYKDSTPAQHLNLLGPSSLSIIYPNGDGSKKPKFDFEKFRSLLRD